MNQSPALLMAASFGVCAALLWLSAALGVAASNRPRPIARALVGVAVLLGACALWWPANALRAPEASRGLNWLLPWLPALLLAGLACAAAVLWDRDRRPGAAACAVAIPVAAYLHAMFSAPGIFRFAPESLWLGTGTMTLGLSIALVVAQTRWREARRAAAARLGGAAAASVICCVGVAFSVTASEAARAVAGPEWLVMIGLMVISAVLLGVLRHAGTPGETQGRSIRPATADNLTGLPTRLFFEGRLQDAAKKCDTRSTQLAVLFIDLDGFKPVNDSFGHSSGDRVLEQVGQRLKAIARGAGVAARVGGDEFLLLATALADRDAVARLAERLIDALSQPYKIDDREVAISCSVGIAMYPEKCHPNKLIARADSAMYAAKRAGGARHCFYAPEMDVDVQQNFDMLRDLRQALANDELELFFQPKIDARSGKVTAAEALLRWNHPTRGMVMPAHFIPLAERSGLIGPLGNWVIEAACKQARAWRDKGLRMRVAINLSAYQMRQDDIADRIADALARHRIHPSLLTCEITETAAMEDTGATQDTFRRLGEMGAHLSIDDFGTGYSSLSYLRQLPAEELKIDASFVKDVDHSADARAVIDAVVKLAHALGLKVVAEGVETLRQHKVLVELGCDELQGYLFAKPMTARALLLWAMDDRSTSAVFRDSLFGETRQASRQVLKQSVRQSG
ncbi:MAG: EAL domain-containing protein [Burkholderiales bacterium]